MQVVGWSDETTTALSDGRDVPLPRRSKAPRPSRSIRAFLNGFLPTQGGDTIVPIVITANQHQPEDPGDPRLTSGDRHVGNGCCRGAATVAAERIPRPPFKAQQRGDPPSDLLTRGLPHCRDEGLLERRQPRVDQPELVEPFARQLEQHDGAGLVPRPPPPAGSRSSSRLLGLGDRNPRYSFAWFTCPVLVWGRAP